VWLSKSINIERRGKTSSTPTPSDATHRPMMRSAAAAHHPMQHTDRCEQQQLTEATAAPGAMERTAKMAEAKIIFMILFDCWCVDLMLQLLLCKNNGDSARAVRMNAWLQSPTSSVEMYQFRWERGTISFFSLLLVF
jgi:hypothetical protein